MPDIEIPKIPETITVHLGPPDSPADNVTLPFVDYIKNVASSEIYPTWPEEAIKANIIAQISVALNRVYTEYYRSLGRDFDITSSTANDQSFVYQRDIFGNIDTIVNEIFNTYITKSGSIAPLFATFCDGVEVSCAGLSQWGSVELANQGLGYEEILRRYYGNDIEIVSGAPVENISATVPAFPLREGDTGRDVESVQLRLNRISRSYPAIPKISEPNGFFGKSTTDAVKEFQRVFSLTDDGVVGNATWYKIQFIYNAVKKLYEVNTEGLEYGELPQNYPGELNIGDTGSSVRALQYYLEYISLFVPTVNTVAVDGIFGTATEDAVISFQKTYGLTPSGRVDRAVWNAIQDAYYNILAGLDYSFTEGQTLPYPGRVIAEGTTGEDVLALQEYLNYISESYPEIPRVSVDGVFGAETERAINAFIDRFGIDAEKGLVGAVLWNAITDLYENLYIGRQVRDGQFPGYTIN